MRAWGDFNYGAGKGIWIGRRNTSSINCIGYGLGMQIDGNAVFSHGSNLDLVGNSIFWVGRDSDIDDFDYVYGFGRRGKAYSDGEFIHSGGKSADSENGLYQTRKAVLGLDTTNATESFMQLPTVGTSIVLPDDSVSCCTVSVSAMKDDGTKLIAWKGDFLVTKISGTARCNNSTGDVTIPTVSSIGSPAYLAEMRAISGAIKVRVTGTASENVRWVASVELTQTHN